MVGAAVTAQAAAVQRANHTGMQSARTISDFAAAADARIAAQKRVANGLASLAGVGGTVPRSRFSNMSGSYWQSVANQAAMLALTAPDPDTLLVVFWLDDSVISGFSTRSHSPTGRASKKMQRERYSHRACFARAAATHATMLHGGSLPATHGARGPLEHGSTPGAHRRGADASEDVGVE